MILWSRKGGSSRQSYGLCWKGVELVGPVKAKQHGTACNAGDQIAVRVFCVMSKANVFSHGAGPSSIADMGKGEYDEPIERPG